MHKCFQSGYEYGYYWGSSDDIWKLFLAVVCLLTKHLSFYMGKNKFVNILKTSSYLHLLLQMWPDLDLTHYYRQRQSAYTNNTIICTNTVSNHSQFRVEKVSEPLLEFNKGPFCRSSFSTILEHPSPQTCLCLSLFMLCNSFWNGRRTYTLISHNIKTAHRKSE